MKTLSKICIHPWSHLAFNPNGDIWPCCHQRNNPVVLGNMHTDKIDDVFNSEAIKKIRTEMLNGKLPEDACGKCKHFESIPVKSPRQSALQNKYAQQVLDEIDTNTKADGTVTDYKIRYWDLRWSNLCNMSCVMCGVDWSSKWTQDIKNIVKNYNKETVEKDSRLNFLQGQLDKTSKKVNKVPNLSWVDKHIHDVEYIYFAGGEPLIMPEHWYILEKLVEQKRFDVKIKYNTNMLKLDYEGKNAVDYWKYWSHEKLIVEGSIDETGARAEWIRYGTNWNKVKNNILHLRNNNIKTQPIISVGCYNVFRLPEIIEELWSLYENPLAKISPYVNPVYNKEFSMDILPNDMKQKTISNIEKLEKTVNIPSWGQQFKKLYIELNKPHSTENAKRFLRKSALLDLHRNTNVFYAIPELEVVNNMYDDLYTKTKEQYNELRSMEA